MKAVTDHTNTRVEDSVGIKLQKQAATIIYSLLAPVLLKHGERQSFLSIKITTFLPPPSQNDTLGGNIAWKLFKFSSHKMDTGN
jgi:hypothetical protein